MAFHPAALAAALAFIPVLATPAPLPAPPQAAATEVDLAPVPDPPARVGRVARVQAGVGYRAPGEAEWSAAGVNLPVAGGTGLQVEPGGRALLELPGVTLAVEGGSAVELVLLEDSALRARLDQGRLGLEVAVLEPGDVLEVATPRGTTAIRKPGRYLVDAGDADAPARLVVYQGQATFTDATGAMLRAGTGQAVVAAAPLAIEPAGPPSPLLAWAVAGDKAGPHPAAVAAMPGGPMLSRYGQWSTHPEYGDVWRPTVQAGWAPFRQGQWRDVEPWGWSWVDDAPWGFAPTHYGRWYIDSGVWWWAPRPFAAGRGPRWPVYAPAVVRFAGLGAGGRGHPVGWVPLAPREPFFPGARFSPRYLRQVNLTTVPPGFAGRPLPGAFPRLANVRGAVMLPINVPRPQPGGPGLRGGGGPLGDLGAGRPGGPIGSPPSGFPGRFGGATFGPPAGTPGFGMARPGSSQGFATPGDPVAAPRPSAGFAGRPYAAVPQGFGAVRPGVPPRSFTPPESFGGPRGWGGQPPTASYAPQPRAYVPGPGPGYAPRPFVPQPSFQRPQSFAPQPGFQRPAPQAFSAPPSFQRPPAQAFSAPRSFSPPPPASRPSFGGGHRR